MAQTIINSSDYVATLAGEPVGQDTVLSAAVSVFADGDFIMTKTPESTIWSDTTQPLRFEILFTNTSGLAIDTVTISDDMPVATAEAAGLTLDVDSITMAIDPAENVTLDSATSTEARLVITAVSDEGSAIVDAANITVSFLANYVPPTGP